MQQHHRRHRHHSHLTWTHAVHRNFSPGVAINVVFKEQEEGSSLPGYADRDLRFGAVISVKATINIVINFQMDSALSSIEFVPSSIALFLFALCHCFSLIKPCPAGLSCHNDNYTRCCCSNFVVGIIFGNSDSATADRLSASRWEIVPHVRMVALLKSSITSPLRPMSQLMTKLIELEFMLHTWRLRVYVNTTFSQRWGFQLSQILSFISTKSILFT